MLMKSLGTSLTAVAMLGTAALQCGTAAAQAPSFPQKPVRLIVPFVPGGATDVIARLLAQGLTERWPHAMLVENRAGAGGSIASELVARANPDGYTQIFASGSVLTANQHMYAKLNHDPGKDLVGVSLVASGPQVIAVAANSKFQSLGDLLAAMRAAPGKLSYGSAGVGSQVHLAGENFLFAAKIEATHVPYKGEAAAIADLLGGQIDWAPPNLGASINFLRDRKLRALAITSPKRSAALPDVPTVAEAGVPGFENMGWFGVAVPRGTPAALTARMADEIQKVASGAAFRERVSGLGMDAVGNRPEEFQKYINEEIARWGSIIRERKITAR